MRLVSVEVVNYKGLRKATLNDIGDLPVVMVSGRNGTGKSLLLEAIVGAWSGVSGQFVRRIGPWGSQLVVDICVNFTPDELDVIDGWHEQMFGESAPRVDRYRVRRTWTPSSAQVDVMDTVVQVVTQPNFQRLHPFSVIDLLGSTRLLALGGSPTVDLPMMSTDRIELERAGMLDAAIVQRSPVSLPSVGNFLATLDYQGLLAEREGKPASDEYKKIAATLEAATGKKLLLPRLSTEEGSVIEVELPEGHRHGLQDLSTGEQETLALSFFARRLSASGGILCLDEPEQHLHPTLQAALFESLRSIADRAQVLIVSHSVNLIVSAPTKSLFQLNASTSEAEDQILRLVDESDRVQLVGELGVAPADLLQTDMLLVVEGETDAQWLRTLFPVEFGRIHVIVAGGGKGVMAAVNTLEATPLSVPWLCLMDRDLMTDDEVASLTSSHKNLYVWPRREFESMLLEAPLLAEVLTSIGPVVSVDRATELLTSAADPLREDVAEALVLRKLKQQVPSPGPASGSRFQKMEAQMRADAGVHMARADLVASLAEATRIELEESWATDWLRQADPKVVLQRLLSEIGIFRDYATFVGALVAKARGDDGVMPPGLAEFRTRVVAELKS